MIINKYYNKSINCLRTLSVECEDNNVDIDLTIKCKGYEKLNTLNLSTIEAKKLLYSLMNIFDQ